MQRICISISYHQRLQHDRARRPLEPVHHDRVLITPCLQPLPSPIQLTGLFMSDEPLAFPQPLQLPVSEATLCQINLYLSSLSAEEILKWALTHLPGLHQTTAFGLTGLVAIDMLSKLTPNPPPLIFLDTLYHFKETYDLVEEVKARYGVDVSVWKPEGCEDIKAFEAKWGEKFWEKDDRAYDKAVKVCFLLMSLLGYGLYRPVDRTSSPGICCTRRSICHNRPTRLPRWCAVISPATRNRFHRSLQIKPIISMDFRARRMVYQGQRCPTQQAFRSGLQKRR